MRILSGKVKDMGKYNFDKDLPIGVIGEKIIQKDLESVGGEMLADNDTNAYDIIMRMPMRSENGKDIVSYEVKTDVYCKPHTDTANMFIEFECRGNASGIEVTKAKWFVTYYPYLMEAWYIKTDDLRKLIADNDFRKTDGSGDAFSGTKGWLIPRYQHKSKFKVRYIPKAWWAEHFE